ncbi:MAG: hypothetical protein ACRENS_07405 [Candidatus Eiseniibacteriota bacterium]
MTQHAALTPERWSRFTTDQQLLMIANEMNRTSKLLGPNDEALRRSGYERTLRLVELSIVVAARPALRRELSLWRDLVAQLYIAPASDAASHGAALRCLLQFSPATYSQLAHLSIPTSA